MSARQFVYETIRHDSRGSEMSIKVTYSAAPAVPAILYGDCPQPAEGGEVEIISITCGGKDVTVEEWEHAELLSQCQELAPEAFAELAAAEEEYRAEDAAERRREAGYL